MNEEAQIITNRDWVPLIEPMGNCKKCTNKEECNKIQEHIQTCNKTPYKFRCPVLVWGDIGETNIKYIGMK